MQANLKALTQGRYTRVGEGARDREAVGVLVVVLERDAAHDLVDDGVPLAERVRVDRDVLVPVKESERVSLCVEVEAEVFVAERERVAKCNEEGVVELVAVGEPENEPVEVDDEVEIEVNERVEVSDAEGVADSVCVPVRVKDEEMEEVSVPVGDCV